MASSIVTWDPIGTNATLSNENMTAYVPGYSYTSRATVGRTIGKWYWELYLSNNSFTMVGVVNGTYNLTADSYSSANCRFYYCGYGSKYPESVAYGGSFSATNITVSVLLDLDNGTLEFLINGVSQGVSHTNLTSFGTVYPAISSGAGGSGPTATANFGATAFTYNVPSGYKPYNYDPTNKMLIKNGNSILKYDTKWINTGLAEPLSELDITTHGMNSINSIPATAWTELDDSFEILNWTDDSTVNPKIAITAPSIVPLYLLTSPKILFWTDDVAARTTTITTSGYNAISLLESANPTVSMWTNLAKNRVLSVAGEKLPTFQYKVELVNGNVLLKDWTPFYSTSIGDTVTMNSTFFTTSLTPYTIRLTTRTPGGQVTTATGTVQLNNVAPTINITMNGGMTADIEIGDVDFDRVKFKVHLNGTQIHPTTGEYTEYETASLRYVKQLRSTDVNVGSDNIIDVYAEDEYGLTQTSSKTFVGEYSGLMFSDPEGNFYTTDLGILLKYLDFETLIAGQTSLDKKVLLKNKYGFAVSDILISVIENMDNVSIELSKTTNPFLTQTSLLYNQTLQPGEALEFYIRISTTKYATSGGNFDIRAKASPVQ